MKKKKRKSAPKGTPRWEYSGPSATPTCAGHMPCPPCDPKISCDVGIGESEISEIFVTAVGDPGAYRRRLEGITGKVAHVTCHPAEQLIRYAPRSERQKKIDKLKRALHLTETAEAAALAVTFIAGELSGNEHPLNDDFRRVHQSVKDIIIEQIKYFEAMNDQQPQPEGQATLVKISLQLIDALNERIATLKVQIEEKDHRISELKLAIQAKERNVDEYMKNSVWEKNKLEQRVHEAEGRVRAFREVASQRMVQINKLEKTNAGLRSRITRLSSKSKR